MSELQKLKRLALAATPGPWEVKIDGTCSGAWPFINTKAVDEEGEPYTVAELPCSHIETLRARSSGEFPGTYAEKPHRFAVKENEPVLDNASFIAAACPQTVLGLIDRIAELERQLAEREQEARLQGLNDAKSAAMRAINLNTSEAFDKGARYCAALIDELIDAAQSAKERM